MDLTSTWTDRFMSLADMVATWSKDPSTKVGAVITSGKEIVSLGFNGFPARTPDNPAHLEDRAEKYPRVVHAELNAILRIRGNHTQMKMFCTHLPCSGCAAAIIASGIEHVITRRPSEAMMARWPGMETTIVMFREAGVELSLIA